MTDSPAETPGPQPTRAAWLLTGDTAGETVVVGAPPPGSQSTPPSVGSDPATIYPAQSLPAGPGLPVGPGLPPAPTQPASRGARPMPLPGGRVVTTIEHARSAHTLARADRRDEETYRSLPDVVQQKYVRAGEVTVAQLLDFKPGQMAHLDRRISDVTAFVQNRLSEQGMSADIQYAREHPNERDEMLQEVDKIALQKVNEDGGYRDSKELAFVLGCVENEVVGYGPIDPLLSDPDVSEVMVNGPDDVWAEYAGKLKRIPGCRFRNKHHVTLIQQLILMPINRSVNPKNPLEDGRLPDGSRVNAVDGSVGLQGPFLTIRRFPDKVWTIMDLVLNGSMTTEMGLLCAKLVQARANVLVAGGTGSGKALDVNTPIPTPTGFARMGDLQVGAQVFDETGKPCSITAVFDQPYGRECFEVAFSDGSMIVADADHNWLTETRSARRAVSRDHGHARKPIYDDAALSAFGKATAQLPTLVTRKQVADALGLTDAQCTPLYQAIKTLPVVDTIDHSTQMVRRGRAYTLTKPVRRYRRDEILRGLRMRYSDPLNDQRHLQAGPSVVTTRDILASLTTPTGHLNHSVQVISSAVQYPHADGLPVDPYLLGIWLGDGCTGKGEIATEDLEIVEAFQAAGFRTKRYSTNRCNIGIAGGFKVALRAAGVLDRKHIPSAYLHADEQQRRALLAGLLDSDGTFASASSVEFYNTNETLAEQTRSLVASLGYQATLRKDPSFLDGIEHQPVYTVEFAAYDDVFRLARKRQAHRAARRTARPERNRRRYITSVRPVPTRDVRCITVDSPHHLFLAGDQYIPTHNTSLLNALSSCIPRDERTLTVEDSAELRLHPDGHVLGMEGRPASSSGAGAVTIRMLVKNALRMRPERIIVGEVRDAAALDMLQAMNTGHEGSMTTVHANSPSDATQRLTSLVKEGSDLPVDNIVYMIASSLDIIIYQKRFEDGSRRVESVSEVMDRQLNDPVGYVRVVPLYEWEQTGADKKSGKVSGEYYKRNDISPELIQKRRLHLRAEITETDLREMSKLPKSMTVSPHLKFIDNDDEPGDAGSVD